VDEAQIEAMFGAVFTDQVVAALVRGLRRAYDAACERHDPAEGGNAQTFGFCCYHFGIFRLAEEFEDSSVGVQTVTLKGAFRMLIGRYQVGCYRVGESEHDDIETCFPHNDRAAGSLVEAQLWLRGISKTQGVERAKKVIVGHLGNPDEGLRAIYLCVPGKKRGARITEWAYTIPLWRAGDAIELPQPPSLPVEEVISPPAIELRDPPQEEDVPPPEIPLNPEEAEEEDEG
jgi:hypothetical protein